MISKEDYEIGLKYLSTIKSIILDKACGSIPIEYSEFLRSKGYSDCNCSAGIFNGTSRFYNQWLEAKAYYESEVRNEDKTKRKRGCPASKDK